MFSRIAATRGWRVLRIVLPGVAGAVAGYLYWAKVGCSSGGCAITSDPWLTTGFGALMGLSLGWPSPERKASRNDTPEEDAHKDGGAA